MINEYFECSCGHSDHTLRFSYFEDEEKPFRTLYAHILLQRDRSFSSRLWNAIKYVFNVSDPCPYGHFDEWIMKNDDVLRLKNLLDTHIKVSEQS